MRLECQGGEDPAVHFTLFRGHVRAVSSQGQDTLASHPLGSFFMRSPNVNTDVSQTVESPGPGERGMGVKVTREPSGE